MYNNVKLEKGLYSIAGKTFTQALTQLDPDESYANTELAGLDAYERQLKRFDIKVSGADSDKVEKFFATTESAVLFPEYVRRAIKQGMDDASVLPEIVASVSHIDGLDYRAFTVTKSGTDAAVSQLASMPETTVKVGTSAKTLSKYARRISFSYEAMRQQRIDAVGVLLRNLGAQISKAINASAISVLGNSITATTIEGTELAYSDLATFWASMTDGEMTTMVCSPAVMAQILALDEMKNCVTDKMTNGKVMTPYGVNLVRCSSITDGKIYGVDKSCAMEGVFGTDVIVDFDKLITTQADGIACSVYVGFSRIFDSGVKILNTSK